MKKRPTPKANPNERPNPSRWIRVAEYAKLCGYTSPTAVTGRINRGTVVAVEQDMLDGSTVTFVDLVASPPSRAAAGRPRTTPTNPAHGKSNNKLEGER